MGVNFKSVLKNRVTRVLLVILLGYILLLATYAISFYHIKINAFKESENAKLTAIANTLSSMIQGDELENLIKEKHEKDAIKTTGKDPIYSKYYTKLNKIKFLNHLETDIYTVFYDKETKGYYFGLSSSRTPHYFHRYSSCPKEYHDLYMNGGHFGPYKDDHGSWFSSLAPIKNRKGEVVSTVQVDLPFEKFIKSTRRTVLTQVAYLSLFLILLGAVIIGTIIKFLKDEEAQLELVQAKNKVITSSITYAQRIQEGILPSHHAITADFPESFILYTPKDVVSGDFYFHSKHYDGTIYFAAADCTGHGVPGAMMSMIATSLLSEQVNALKSTCPGTVLDKVDANIKKAFRIDRKTRDGMDIALCSINKDTLLLQFAGAHRPLFIFRNNELLETKGTPFSIGDVRIKDSFEGFKCHDIQLEIGDCIYLFSDGYVDQFNGETGKKYMTKKLKSKLLAIHQLPMKEQQTILHNDFLQWKGSSKQIDDVVVLGMKITG